MQPGSPAKTLNISILIQNNWKKATHVYKCQTLRSWSTIHKATPEWLWLAND